MPVTPAPISARRSTVVFNNLSGMSVTIPNPELGDLDAQLNYISTNTNGQGGISIFKIAAAPKARLRELVFKDIEESIVDDFKEFIRVNIGKTVRYTDMENVNHNVLILDPDTINFEETNNGTCNFYTFSVGLLERIE